MLLLILVVDFVAPYCGARKASASISTGNDVSWLPNAGKSQIPKSQNLKLDCCPFRLARPIEVRDFGLEMQFVQFQNFPLLPS